MDFFLEISEDFGTSIALALYAAILVISQKSAVVDRGILPPVECFLLCKFVNNILGCPIRKSELLKTFMHP